MNGHQLEVQRTALKEMLQRLDRIRVACGTCEHYTGLRCVKYDAIPPAETVISGCPEWEFDGVPF